MMIASFSKSGNSRSHITTCRLLSGLMASTFLFTLGFGSASYAQETEAEAAADTLKTIVVTGEDEAGDGPVVGDFATISRSGTKTDAPLVKTPQSISVVSEAQATAQGATSVAQALRYTAGVVPEYRGASNMHDEVIVRGFDYAPKYVDGLSMGYSRIGQIDPSFLERVEVIKGPTSALFGQTSPGGMVNMVTKKATGERVRKLSLSTGLDQRIQATFDVADRLNDSVAFRLIGNAEGFDAQEDRVENRRYSIAPSLKINLSDQTVLDLQATLQHEPELGLRNFRMRPGTVDPTAHGYIPADFFVGDPNFQESKRDQMTLSYELEHEVNDALKLRSKAMYSSFDWKHKTLVWWNIAADGKTIDRIASNPEVEQQQFNIDNQVEGKFELGGARHTLLAGADYAYSVVKSDTKRAFSGVPKIDWTNPVYGHDFSGLTFSQTQLDRVKASQLGLYAQDLIEYGNLTLALSGRYDWATTEIHDQIAGSNRSIKDQAFSGRAGLSYQFANGLTPYASFSTSFQPVATAPATGQPDFEASKARQLEAGVKWVSNDDKYMLGLAAYQINQTNVLSWDPVLRRNEQVGEVETRGLELEAHARINDAFAISGSFSITDPEIAKAVDSADVGKKMTRTPEYQASIWADYEFAFGLGVGAGIRHMGKSWGDSANSFEVSEVTLVDAALRYDFGKLNESMEGAKLQVNANNLLDEFYAASCNSRFACFVGNGRTVKATLSYEW